MSLDAIRKTKHETWCSGVEAFADYVYRSFSTAIEGVEASQIADSPCDWETVKKALVDHSAALQRGRDYVFTLSPFLPMELQPQEERKVFKAYGRVLKNTSGSTAAGGTND